MKRKPDEEYIFRLIEKNRYACFEERYLQGEYDGSRVLCRMLENPDVEKVAFMLTKNEHLSPQYEFDSFFFLALSRVLSLPEEVYTLFKLLLEHGVDPNTDMKKSCSKNGRMYDKAAYHHICTNKCTSDFLAWRATRVPSRILSLLLSYGFDVNINDGDDNMVTRYINIYCIQKEVHADSTSLKKTLYERLNICVEHGLDIDSTMMYLHKWPNTKNIPVFLEFLFRHGLEKNRALMSHQRLF